LAVADPKSSQDERNLARAVLLFKEATRGQYANFLRDFSPAELTRDLPEKPVGWATQARKFLWAGTNDPFQCPALNAVIGELAGNARSSHALLCLGEFVRLQFLDGFEDGRPKPAELGGGKSIFPGEPFSRGEVYKKLIADPRRRTMTGPTPSIARSVATSRAGSTAAAAPTSTRPSAKPGTAC